MWHSVVLLVVCVLTNALQWRGVDSRLGIFLAVDCWSRSVGARVLDDASTHGPRDIRGKANCPHLGGQYDQYRTPIPVGGDVRVPGVEVVTHAWREQRSRILN